MEAGCGDEVGQLGNQGWNGWDSREVTGSGHSGLGGPSENVAFTCRRDADPGRVLT